MRAMNKHEKINYIELPAKDIAATKAFFTRVFSWKFQDYGAEYSAFSDGVIDGGFFLSGGKSCQADGAALVVFYSNDLEATLKKVEAAGGIVVKSIFSFPGGRRFHFTEPSGNEFAVWSELDAR
jgi:predicted enzyme related to lactoylglutathione lyase